MKFNLHHLCKTSILIRGLAEDNQEIWRQVVSNHLTNAMPGILISALLRSGPSAVTHLYARFGDNDVNPGILAPPSSDPKKVVRGTFLHVPGGNTVLGALWVPILAAPLQDTSDTDLYSGNQATFYFRIPYNIAAAQLSPASNFHLTTSYIASLGLAAAVSIADRSQDLIITQLQAPGDFSAFYIPPAGQISVDYTIKLELPED